MNSRDLVGPNANVLRQLYELLKAGELERVLDEYYDDSIRLYVPGRNILSGVYQGKSQIRQFFEAMGTVAGLEFDLLEVLSSDKAVSGYYELRVKRNGEVTHRWNRMNLYCVRAGRIYEAHIHESDQYVVDKLYGSPAGAGSQGDK